MLANVYHITPPANEVPEDDIPSFVRAQVHDLIGYDTKGISFSAEQLHGEDSLRIVLTVPQRLEDVVNRIANAGLAPAHTEPEGVEWDEASCTVPRAFQVHHFGFPVSPQFLRDNPAAMAALAGELAENAPNIPHAAIDYIRWLGIESTEQDVLTIRWAG